MLQGLRGHDRGSLQDTRDRQENFDNMVQIAKSQEGKHSVIEEQRVMVLLDEQAFPTSARRC